MSQVFREYHLVEQLARKRSSSLYLTEHSSDPEKQAVVKVFTSVQFTEEQEQAQFLQEISLLSQLNFPHILPILDAGIERIHPYILTRYIPSGSLKELLRNGSLTLESIIQIIKQVGQSLMYAHGWDIVHANLKTENIFLEADNHVLLTDFKIPSIFQAVTQSNIPGARIDTRSACYMAPEQFDGITSPETDQYALGCLAYELLTGQLPFIAASLSTLRQRHIHDVPTTLISLRSDLPPHLDKAVLQAMAKRPEQRFASISDFLMALEYSSPENVIDSASSGPVKAVPPIVADVEESPELLDNILPNLEEESGPPLDTSNDATHVDISNLHPATALSMRKRRPIHITAVAVIAACLVILLSVAFLPRVFVTSASLTSSGIASNGGSADSENGSTSGQPGTTPTSQSRSNRSTGQEGAKITPTTPSGTSNTNEPPSSNPTSQPTSVPPTATQPRPKPTHTKPTPTPSPTPKPTETSTPTPTPTEGSWFPKLP
ncbi:serine/threonine protein kinase [Ktedonospora formicarum]|uniref:non-specific serine/threonine protein kinase n=1 Tax=Ktedonospora formicarum TaxID=2778364 RepID=A0A8J3MWW2_9CHLR|nr:serine/threonine-protein kinase [Ktedonospora formicarum]GHO49391.1 hypothetical protein KSX_75540 [Ktedonospora formicarum]